MNLHTLYGILEIAGTFAFALSGATAAKQKRLDVFGIFVIAYIVSSGGGILRDLCIGTIPPAGLSSWTYPVSALIASTLVTGFYPLSKKLRQPVLLFDAAGLSLFAVTGAQKALAFGHNEQVAVLLGVTTAVGGGVLRDLVLNRVPVILQREIYATAALSAALIVVAGRYLPFAGDGFITLTALGFSFSLRVLALRFHWNLPAARRT